MKERQKIVHMYAAYVYAQLSYATKKKVGCIVVNKDGDRVISIGYNGTPAGWDNSCDYEVTQRFGNDVEEMKKLIQEGWSLHYDGSENGIPTGGVAKKLKTSPHVNHAEHNAICKLAKSPESGEGAYMFITYSPCINCAKLIADSGISNVIYKEQSRHIEGISYLQKRGVNVEQLKEQEEGEQEWNQLYIQPLLERLKERLRLTQFLKTGFQKKFGKLLTKITKMRQ